MNALFATTELRPLVRDGSLAEISWGLPQALSALGHDVRLVLPGYTPALLAAYELGHEATLELTAGREPVRIISGQVPGSRLPIYLITAPSYFEREGGPYANADGDQWADNAERFALFCRAIVEIATGRAGLDWRPDIVHCNDWQTGLIPAFMSLETKRPATLFTVHDLAAQGLFSWDVFHRLQIPRSLWSRHGLEHYGNFSFVKGGLAYSDRINTVSPTYAGEIQTEALGYGLEEVLRRHSDRLVGILNGVNYQEWDPRFDLQIPVNYGPEHPEDKRPNKAAVLRRLGLPEQPNTPLLMHTGRLEERRGSDLLLEIVPELEALDVQLAVLGHGGSALENEWTQASRRFPDRVAAVIGADQALSHLLIAGADMIVVPSRVEPCGLHQLHGMRYGTVPIVRQTGGLGDTVHDCGDDPDPAPDGTGFCFVEAHADALMEVLGRAANRIRDASEFWTTLMRLAMTQDFGWRRSALRYQTLYALAIAGNRHQQ